MKQTRKLTTLLLLTLVFVVAVTALTACKPKDYDMSGVTFSDATFTYDGTEKKIEIAGTLPEGVTVAYTNNTLTNVGEVTATATFTGDGKHNPIPPMTAKLKITPATQQGITLADKTVTYNGQEQVLEVAGALPQGSSVQYTNNKATNAGVYNVTAVITNSNYETLTLNATLTIEKATYDMSGITFADKTVTYNGEEQRIAIAGTLPQGVTVTYENNTLTNAGSVTATATFAGDSTNYNAIADMTATLTIEKATYDMSGITFADKTVTYNGEEQSIAIAGTLPQGVTVTYANNTLTNAGSVTATATFTGDTANYNAIEPKTATLTIEKATYDMSDIVFADKTVTYNGEEQSIVIAGALPQGVTVTYANNTLTNAGSTMATATFTGDSTNYNAIESKTATLIIEKATYDMSGVTFEDKTVTYNGEAQSVVISGTLPQGVTVSYANNTITNVGSTTATATFTGDGTNYNAIEPKTATLTIEKATYDMSGVTFEDKTVTYNGEAQSLTIVGDLPQGVTVTYANNTLTNAGSTTATATFTGDGTNYNVIDPKTATLTIEKATYDMSYIVFADKTVTYNGEAQSIVIAGTLPQGVTVTYANNILTNVGSTTATATFTGDTANYNAIEPKTATLTIEKATYDMNNIVFADKTVTYNGEPQSLIIIGELPQGVTVQYSGNTLTNAGSVTATATFVGDSANYNAISPKTATLTIEKATYDMSDISFVDAFVPYDGQPHTLEITGALPQGVTVQYTENTLTEAGELSVTATFTGDTANYNAIPSKTALLTIVDDGSYHAVMFMRSETDIVLRVVKDGEAVTNIPEVPEKAGYKGSWDADLSAITQEMVVLPKYEVITYVIGYVVGDGTNNPNNPTQYTVEQTLSLLSPTPNKIGYTFAGWFTTDTYEAGTRVYAIATGTTGNKTLYAKWIGYCIESAEGFTFDYKNYELPAITMTVSHSKTLLPLSTAIQVSEGCTWKLSNDIEGTAIITTKNISLQVGHNIKYVTVWYNENSDYNLVYILDVKRLDEYAYSFINDGVPYGEATMGEENSHISEPVAPEKTGYTFLGWLANGATTVATFPYKLTTPTVFVASYKANEYTITYVSAGGTLGGEETQTVTFDQPFVLQNIARTGYTFTGYTHNDLPFVSGIWTIDSDISITATWKAIDYTITYNLDGGTNAIANPATYTIEDDTIVLAQATKRGYTFNGWFTTEDFQEGTQITQIAAGSHGNVKVWAKFTVNVYNISYTLNGGANDASNPATYTVEDSITFAEPTKTGYTFKGWFTTENFAEGTQVTSIAKSSIDDVALHAKFTPNTYTITAVVLVDEGSGEPTPYELFTQEVTFDSAYTLQQIDLVGYDFVKYVDLDGEDFTDGTYTIADDIYIVGIYQAIVYNITYNLNGGTNDSTNPATYTIEDDTITFAEPTKTGYTFNGLFTTEDFQEGTQVTSIAKGSIDDVALFAKFTPNNYTITYLPAGGTLDGETTQTVTYDADYTLNTDISRTGYTFTGYTLGGEAFTSGTYQIADNVTITANWQANTYTVIYVWQGETVGTTTATYDSPFTFATNVGNDSYEAVKWLCGNTEYLSNSATTFTIAEDVTLTAVVAYISTDFTFTTSGTNATITGYNGTDTDVVIPGYVKQDSSYYIVTAIGAQAFKDKTTIKSVTIPSSVTSVGEHAFYNCSSFTNIKIPASVTSIGSNVFYSCSSLTGVYISDLTAWCNISFSNEYANPLYYARNLYLNGELLTDLVIPNTVVEIKSNAFYRWNGTSVTFAENSQCTSIGSSAFYGCFSLTSITIPDSVTSVGERAFYNCSSFTNIKIPASVTSIGSNVFYSCSSLTGVYISDLTAWCNISFSNEYANPLYNAHNLYLNGELVTDIIIPKTVTAIKDHAFCGCRSLETVTFANNSQCTSIGDFAFEYCRSLTSITIPSGVTSIGDSAFSQCYSLTSITIPSSVRSIGSYAFSGCSSLTSITIPSNVTSIGDSAFGSCSLLVIFCETTSKPYGWNEYWNYGDCPVVWGSTNVVLIDGIRYALQYNNATVVRPLSNKDDTVTIPQSVTYNGTTYPVTSIGYAAFYKCSSLTSIAMPSGITSIGIMAFYACDALTSITIPARVTSIGADAFSNCSALTGVYISDIVAWYSISFGYYTANPLYNAHNLYLNGELVTDIVIPKTVTAIKDHAFCGCRSLETVTFANNSQCTSIGIYAFNGCGSLTSMTIPRNIASIGDYAFDNCSSLIFYCEAASKPSGWSGAWNSNRPVVWDCNNNAVLIDGIRYALKDGEATVARQPKDIGGDVTIPQTVMHNGTPYTVTGIGEYAFSNCSSLTSITIPASVTSIGKSAFSYCNSLTSITIPEGVTSIGSSAFFYCSSLTSITIPASVTSIDSFAFNYCSSLTSITIPSSVTSIGSSAFYYCNSLTTVYYGGTTTQWSAISIGSSNTKLTNAMCYYYSETNPFEGADAVTSGNYWHYDTNGTTPIVWKKEN